MNLYVLGGSGKKNIDWVETIADHLRNLFDSVKIQWYEHWDLEENTDLNVDTESKKLVGFIANDTNYFILAKSAGSLTTLKAIKEYGLAPKACVFCGFPLMWAKERNIPVWEYLKGYSIPTTFIQNSLDPFCSSACLKELLKEQKCVNYQLIEEISDTHNYDNPALFRKVFYYYLSSTLN